MHLSEQMLQQQTGTSAAQEWSWPKVCCSRWGRAALYVQVTEDIKRSKLHLINRMFKQSARRGQLGQSACQYRQKVAPTDQLVRISMPDISVNTFVGVLLGVVPVLQVLYSRGLVRQATYPSLQMPTTIHIGAGELSPVTVIGEGNNCILHFCPTAFLLR